MDIKSRITSVTGRIAAAARRSGRSPESVRLVAVSKTVSAERMRSAVDCGISIFGENYIQEARSKFDRLSDCGVSWHFIGHLQTNKAKYAVRMFDLIHSVDSIRLARELDKQAGKTGKVQDVLVQVNLANEETKGGSSAEEAVRIVEEIAGLDNLRVRGLMTMPPFFEDPQRARPFFSELRSLRDLIEAKKFPGTVMTELSMGMTGDFETAVEEGATLVRVGTAIFGERR